ncbi:cation-translocating P-type ATPase [Patescibacteria group bacterium]|nr:cation-translocating P-type ATPase [Patescibacteria group bacterium]
MKGLTSQQADSFLKQYGLNVISEPPKSNFIIKFFEQFNNFLTILLIFAAIFSLLIGETVDGILVFAIVVLNAFFGLYQEGKAEESLKVLKQMTASRVRVIRDGKQMEINSELLVPGDVVYLEEGVKLSADGQLIESVNLEINEASLTGESLAVAKQKNDEIFSGTIVSRGRGMMKVLKTGDSTKFGQIAKNLSLIKEEMTPLQKKLADLARMIGVAGIVLSLLVFLVSLLEGTGYFPAFLLAVSLAVAVVPEGLPAVMTITLAIGMKKMASKKAIVRRLSAIESLGSITLIATDKTGTLTANKMKVREIFVIHDKNIEKLILNGILCSTASLVYVHDHERPEAANASGRWDVLGDPTEGALLYFAKENGFNIEEERNRWKLVEESPFDSVTKMMSVVVKETKTDKNPPLQFSKGAPESIINVCKLSPEEKKTIVDKVDAWSREGLRVLAFSSGDRFLGMVAIHDAPRPEVEKAIEKTKKAGIKVIMITGDNEKTAESIGMSIGLIKKGDEIITGVQLDKYSDQELLALLPKIKIFARTNPFQKHRIVKLYQEAGEVVAVTGDGVNDAIALKQADVGVAMGLVGTDVARETADVVITDDNFATIVIAIEEGRGIINSIKNTIKYLLSCNVSEALSLTMGLILGLPTLFYPIQLLYINLVTDGLPALLLSFSPRYPGLMATSPQKELVLLRRRDQIYIGAVGAVGAFLVIGAYFIFANLGKTAAFSVLTLIQSFIFIDLWLSHRHIHENLHHLVSPLFILAFSIPMVFQFIILSHPFAAGLFKINTVGVLTYIEFVLMSFFVLVGIRVVKKAVKL